MAIRILALLLLLAFAAFGQQYFVYVGDVSSDSAVLAWGTTSGKNTIGRSSPPHGKAIVRAGDRRIEIDEKNWVEVTALEPDTRYPFEVSINGRAAGSGEFHTHPVKAERLRFFVIGDFGDGSKGQRAIAAAMASELEMRRESDNPVRFILTTGDNVYGKKLFAYKLGTGSSDKRWRKTFFEPYQPLLRHVPFYITLGNHDGNESEGRGDLAAQLDNFFFPGNEPARWYHFNYAGLVDFFALDSTAHTKEGPERPQYLADGEQFQWLKDRLPEATAPWKIVYYHNPPFSAGPRHDGKLRDLRHIHELCVQHGVQAVFNGHEHNFQFTAPEKTGGIQYVVTGSGGQLRSGRVSRAEMEAEHIAGWTSQHQFLSVTIEGGRMTITPIGSEPIRPVNPAGQLVSLPLVVER